MTVGVSVSYLRVLTILLGLIPVDSLEKKKRQSVDEDEDMEDADWKEEELAGSSPRSPEGLNPRIMRWLSLAYDNNHLNDMLGSLEPMDASLDVLAKESIGQITQLLLNLITFKKAFLFKGSLAVVDAFEYAIVPASRYSGCRKFEPGGRKRGSG
ncbi:hypothetical protein BGZ92_005013 [Podila epicladia]|nr:hypothetical protein BGZ92_005013 [Podila epicladia]